MGRFDSLLDRVTEKLARDPELRLEVRHELATHLEECAGEFETGGSTKEEAAKKAAESFGNAEEVAERLYAANRHRMKVRNVVRWVGRLTLAPAAIAVLVPITTGAVASMLMLAAVMGGLQVGQAPSAPWIERSILAHLSPAQRFIFKGPPGELSYSQKAKAILERYPNDPVMYANYATASLMDPGAIQTGTKDSPSPVKPEDVERLVAIMERGAALEPDNAYYPLLKATILFDASTRQIDEPEEQRPGFAWTAPETRGDDRWTFNRLEVLNRPLFDRAIAAFHVAAGKQTLNDHTKDFLERRLDLLPPAKTLGEELYRMSVEWSTLLPDLNYIRMGTEDAASVAIQEAEAGHRQRALDLLRDSKAIAALEEHGSNLFVVGLLVSWATHKNALAEQIVVDELLKMPDQVAAAKEKLRQDEEFYRQARQDLRGYRYEGVREDDAETRAHNRQLGFVETMTTPSFTDWSKTNLNPGRNAEYAVVDQLAVILAVVALLGVVAARIGRMLFYRWRHGNWPTFIFVGWGQLMKILGLAIVLPIGAYIGYLAIFGAREYGLPVSLEREAVELALLGGGIAIGLRLLTYSAIRQRCIELGLTVGLKYRPSRITLTIGMMLLASVAFYGIYRHMSVRDWPQDRFDGWGAGIAIAIVLYAAVALRPGRKPEAKPAQKVSVPTSGDGWNRPLRPVVVAGTIGAMAIGVVLMFAIGGHRTYSEVLLFVLPYFIFILLVMASAAFGVGRLVQTFMRRQVWSEPLLGVRASIPVLLLAALLLSVGAGGLARWNERRNAARFESSALNLTTELERSRLRVLRDRMQAEPI